MRGEVSIFRGAAGGILYFSSGSFRGSLRTGASVCPEIVVSTSIQVRPRKQASVKAVEDLIAWLRVGGLKWQTTKRQAIHEAETPNRPAARFP